MSKQSFTADVQGMADSPLKEVRPPAVGVDSGQTLQAAGEVRVERRLADVVQPFQFTNQHSLKTGQKKKKPLEKSHTTPWCLFSPTISSVTQD